LLAFVGAASLASALVSAACSDETTPLADGGGASADGPSVAPAMCPDALPEQGASCTLPEGTTCAFGACASYAVCVGGVWSVPPRPKPQKLCPKLVPDEGTTCGDCFEDGGACTYGDPTCADAATNAATATCRRGKFTIALVTCVEAGADAASSDAAPSDADASD